jgi:cytochrome P450
VAFKKHKESPFFRFAVQRIRQEVEKPTPDEVPKRTLLQHFVVAKSRYPDVVDDTQIRLYCATNSLAGSLSPSRVLDCVLSWLAQHPQEQDRLYEEVVKNTKDFPVSLEDTVNMPYLEGVIREGYRLHHGGDIAIERKVGPNGTTLHNGRFIPAGYDLAISSPSIRVCSAFGEEPHVFRPERWMRAKGENEHDFKTRRTYMDKVDLTFSQGSRACIGKSFTHLELFKVVASVMGQFKVRESHIYTFDATS